MGIKFGLNEARSESGTAHQFESLAHGPPVHPDSSRRVFRRRTGALQQSRDASGLPESAPRQNHFRENRDSARRRVGGAIVSPQRDDILCSAQACTPTSLGDTSESNNECSVPLIDSDSAAGVDSGRRRRPLADRFWEKVDQSAGPAQCWPWTGARNQAGYGKIGLGRYGENEYAHRVSFYLAFGFYPPETTDHLCSNKWCVNPAHLEAVSYVVNSRRARPLTCSEGHPLEGHNVLLVRDKHRVHLMRRCRTCHNAYQRGRKRALRASRSQKGAA